MIKLYRISNFDVKQNHLKQFRRGFVIPYPYERGKVLFVADDKHIDHERLADNFIGLSDVQIKDLIMEQGISSPEEFNEVFKIIEGYQKKYKRKEEKYPTSRKDFLVYEEGAVAYDESSAYGKFVIYRDTARGFRIDPETERIVAGYMMAGWKAQPAPENSLQASNENFFGL